MLRDCVLVCCMQLCRTLHRVKKARRWNFNVHWEDDRLGLSKCSCVLVCFVGLVACVLQIHHSHNTSTNTVDTTNIDTRIQKTQACACARVCLACVLLLCWLCAACVFVRLLCALCVYSWLVLGLCTTYLCGCVLVLCALVILLFMCACVLLQHVVINSESAFNLFVSFSFISWVWWCMFIIHCQHHY